MTTIELAPTIDEQANRAPDDRDDHRECHLYLRRDKSMCGLPKSRDTHSHAHGKQIDWLPGMLSCPECGIPICVDCLLAANAK